MTTHARARRMREQEWLYDRLIRSNGPDFYWPMTKETPCTAGMDGAGEDDDLSPIEHSYRLYDRIAGPKLIVVYRGEVHGVTDNLDVRALIADWMRDRFDGKPFESRRVLMDCRTGLEIDGS